MFCSQTEKGNESQSLQLSGSSLVEPAPSLCLERHPRKPKDQVKTFFLIKLIVGHNFIDGMAYSSCMFIIILFLFPVISDPQPVDYEYEINGLCMNYS